MGTSVHVEFYDIDGELVGTDDYNPNSRSAQLWFHPERDDKSMIYWVLKDTELIGCKACARLEKKGALVNGISTMSRL